MKTMKNSRVSRLVHMLWMGVLTVAVVTPGCGRDDARPGASRSGTGSPGPTLPVLTTAEPLAFSAGDTLHLSPHTIAFYEARGWAPAWTDENGPVERGETLHEAIGRAHEDGLPVSRYRHDAAAGILGGAAGGSIQGGQLAALDVLLTEGIVRLATDLHRGMLDPEEAGVLWAIARPEVTERWLLHEVLLPLVEGEDPERIIGRLRPSVPHYDRMREALAHYLDDAGNGGEPPLLPEGPTLRAGDRSPEVALLRDRLVAGIHPRESSLAEAGSADPTLFDDRLEEAVQHFQGRHGLDPDGIVGTDTFKELNHTLDERIEELRLNLDRWRWLPDDLGDRFILVNIAGFELEVVDGGRTIESMNVIVGALEQATPVFADSMQHVVVNPYWNVPDGIMERTIRPAMEENPDYLEENDMEVVDGRVRQRPGPQNALGRYKFMFPNEYNVYLHDTPEGHLFDRAERAFSAGCVRLERPADFARLLMELQSDQDPEVLEPLLETGEEHWVTLDRPLPIYLLYFTAWVKEDGTVRFHHDIYGQDAGLEEQAEERR